MCSETKQYNIGIVGDHGVGKSTFIDYWKSSHCEESKDIDGNLVVVTEFRTTSHGILPVCLKEYSRQPSADLDGVIIMFDLTKRVSYGNVRYWFDAINQNIPTVLCGNKFDSQNRRVMPFEINEHQKRNCEYYDMSCNSYYNFEKPLQYLLRKITGKELDLYH